MAKASGRLRNMLRRKLVGEQDEGEALDRPGPPMGKPAGARLLPEPAETVADRPVERGAAAVPARRPDLVEPEADDILRCHGIPPCRSGDPATVRGERAR